MMLHFNYTNLLSLFKVLGTLAEIIAKQFCRGFQNS